MPQLIAFRRKWSIASDDFVFAGSLDAFIRFIWLVVVSVIFGVFYRELFCDGRRLEIYFIGLVVFLAVTVLLTAMLVYYSMQGTIADSAPRKPVVPLIYIRLAIAIPEVTWNTIGTAWAFNSSTLCRSEVLHIARGTVIAGWILFAFAVITLIVVFDAFGGKTKTSRTMSPQRSFKRGSTRPMHKSKEWEKRCRCLFCCASGDSTNTGVFTTLARLSADYFRGVDLVPTDVVAGLILVSRKQKLERQQLQSVEVITQQVHKVEQDATVLDIGLDDRLAGPKPWMTLDNMSHFLKFALGSYGWPFYVMLTNPVFGACALGTHCRCCPCLRPSRQYRIKGDNCCLCNTAAFAKTSNIHKDDIVFASFQNEIYEIPFYVAIDRESKSVVIAVRGTLSMQDVITDLSAEREDIGLKDVPNSFAHSGILHSAQYIRRTLEEEGILEEAFSRAQGAQLVVTGHSLGAGAAALLAILLKPNYPDVICFAYAPPGELVSQSVSEHAQSFVCSVVLGDDMIARQGMLMMEELKMQILRALEECDLPKYKILAAGCWSMCCGGQSQPRDTEDSYIREDSCPSADNNNRSSLQASLQKTTMHTEQFKATYQPLCQAGQILHVRESDVDGESAFSAVWVQPEVFSEIIVSQNMLAHHFPDALLNALDDLRARNYDIVKQVTCETDS